MCKHEKTVLCSFEAGYYWQCIDCEKQWDESQLEDLENERYLVNYYLGL